MTESTKVIVTRLEERLKSFIEINAATHDIICKKLDTLTDHVNHENEKMDARVVDLENKEQDRRTASKTTRNIYKGVAYFLGIALTVLGILAYLRII